VTKAKVKDGEKMSPKIFTLIKEKKITKEQVMKDVMAGIIVAIIALPLSIALGISSGVSPEKGLITAIVAGFIISFLGGSRVQIGGPTGAFVVIVYTIWSYNSNPYGWNYACYNGSIKIRRSYKVCSTYYNCRFY